MEGNEEAQWIIIELKWKLRGKGKNFSHYIIISITRKTLSPSSLLMMFIWWQTGESEREISLTHTAEATEREREKKNFIIKHLNLNDFRFISRWFLCDERNVTKRSNECEENEEMKNNKNVEWGSKSKSEREKSVERWNWVIWWEKKRRAERESEREKKQKEKMKRDLWWLILFRQNTAVCIAAYREGEREGIRAFMLQLSHPHLPMRLTVLFV